jgi:uncharacterized protein YcnI
VKACGTGYDPVMLALHGFDAYGLEISSTAVSVAREYAKAQMEKPDIHHWAESGKTHQPAGKITFIKGDFFDRAWEADLPLESGGFDLVYDYTVSTNTIFDDWQVGLMRDSFYVLYHQTCGSHGRTEWGTWSNQEGF